jgi:hypothetical protein
MLNASNGVVVFTGFEVFVVVFMIVLLMLEVVAGRAA